MSRPIPLLLTGAFAWTPEEIRELESFGFRAAFIQDERCSIDGDLSDLAGLDHLDVAAFEAVVCNGLFLHNDIRRFESLRFIQLTSAGLDRVPLDYIREKGIRLSNVGDAYATPMAEWALMVTLELLKQAQRFHRQQDERRWEKLRDIGELAGMTACIVGMGNVGRRIAGRLKAFEVTVIGVTRTGQAPSSDCRLADRWASMNELDEVLPESDLIFLALPLTDETRHLMDARRLARVKPGALLINAARGALLDEQALSEALQSGLLGGAALDVFEKEPLPADSPLWTMENVIVTPHISFVSQKNHARLFRLIRDNLRLFAESRLGKEFPP